MQGSLAYGTLNDPAQKPPQEMDLDDGLFLPVSFLAGNGQSHPALISQGLFFVVENALEKLCQRKKGWTLDRSKPSCVRVCLPGHAHVDVALYSIPDAEFDELSRRMLKEATYDEQGLEIHEWLYHQLPASQIMLAHRHDGWKPSDPRELENWFRKAISRHETRGEVLRRVCRYLKAWRDFQWRECKLSSIALMACAVQTFDALASALPANRDDLALEEVAKRLPEQLRHEIKNPVVDGQRLDEGWTPAMRQDYASRAHEFAAAVTAAVHQAQTATEAIQALQRVLGPRIPDDASLVRSDDEPRRSAATIEGAPAILTSGLLRNKSKQPDPVIKQERERRFA